MKALKTILKFASEYLVRPLLFVAFIVLFLDYIYVRFIFSYPEFIKEDKCTVEGVVREKEYDSEANIVSVYVNEYAVYPPFEGSFSEVKIGDRVKISGELKNLECPMNRGETDYRKYFLSRKVKYKIQNAHIISCEASGFSFRESCLSFRRSMASRIKEACKLEYGTINTLLLGDKSELNQDRKDIYMRVGVSHFLVISGIHISAIGSLLYKWLKRTGVKRIHASACTLAFLILYGFTVGFTISVKRAVIMFSVRLFADVCKRIYDMLSAASVALIITLIMNPLSLYDSAFIYSYATIFAIGFYSTYISNRITGERTIFTRLQNLFRLPLVISLFIAPVTLSISYYYSYVSIVVNALLVSLAGPVLILSMFSGICALTNLSSVAKLTDILLAISLKLLDEICLFFGKFSFLSVTGHVPEIGLVLYYAMLMAYFMFLRKRASLYYRVTFLLSILTLLTFFNPNINRLSMLYVGQGECIVIHSSLQHAVLIDCGSTSKKEIEKTTVIKYLCNTGVNIIDAIFVTHSDEDHIGAVVPLLKECDKYGIKIKNLILPDIALEARDKMYADTVSGFNEKGTDVLYAKRGDSFFAGGIGYKVHWPVKGANSGDANTDSLIMTALINGKSVLLTGDATSETEEKVIDCIDDIDVLKVSHHGSKYGTSDKMLHKFKPEYAIISAGINNRYSHPHRDVLSRLDENDVPFLCTKDVGEIDIIFYARDRMLISGFLK